MTEKKFDLVADFIRMDKYDVCSVCNVHSSIAHVWT